MPVNRRMRTFIGISLIGIVCFVALFFVLRYDVFVEYSDKQAQNAVAVATAFEDMVTSNARPTALLTLMENLSSLERAEIRIADTEGRLMYTVLGGGVHMFNDLMISDSTLLAAHESALTGKERPFAWEAFLGIKPLVQGSVAYYQGRPFAVALFQTDFTPGLRIWPFLALVLCMLLLNWRLTGQMDFSVKRVPVLLLPPGRQPDNEDFVANVSHELRAPLTLIQGNLQAVVDGAVSAEEAQEALQVALGESHRLSRLVSELLDLRRLRSGEAGLDYAPFDINEVFRRALIAYAQRIDTKQISVDVQFRTDPCTIEGDKARMEQVALNLLDNAVKFVPEGGEIRVWTQVTPTEARITVSDDGPGIPAADLPHIFERFYTADKSHAPQAGFGLGLAIAKEIVTLHGGKIAARNMPGSGAVFIILLPLRKETPEPENAGPANA